MPYLFRAFGTHLFLHRFALLLLHLTALGRVCGQTVLNLNRLTFFSFNANILIANLVGNIFHSIKLTFSHTEFC